MIDLKEHFAKRQSWLNFALVHKRIDLFIQELQVGWVAARTGSCNKFNSKGAIVNGANILAVLFKGEEEGVVS